MTANATRERVAYDAGLAHRKVATANHLVGERRIVTVLPRGEAIRNFVQSGTLDLVASNSELTLLTVAPDADAIASLGQRYDHVLELAEMPERYPVRILRELLDLAHGRQLWSAAAQERWRLRDAEATTTGRRIKRMGKKLACIPFATKKGVLRLERLERAASKALAPATCYEKLFTELRPTLLFNGSHVHSKVAIQAVQAAQWLGIPTATFIFSWDNLTSQGRILPAYDYYLVWNEDIKQQLLKIYPRISADCVFVTGTPQFDFHFHRESFCSREEYCRNVGADPDRPIVLYSTGMAEHMPGEPLIVEQIADMLLEMPDPRPQLLVRVYPKDRTGRFDDLELHRPDIVFPEARWISGWLTPTESDNQMLTNTLRHVDVGINVASTISLELCMFDKPVINVAYNPPGMASVRVPYARYYEFDHYQAVVESGAVQLSRNPEEMRSQLRGALTTPSALRGKRRSLMQRMFGETLDGRSSERVAQVLLDLAATARVCDA